MAEHLGTEVIMEDGVGVGVVVKISPLPRETSWSMHEEKTHCSTLL